MYNSEDAKKSYLILLKEKGVSAIFKSVMLIVTWYILDKFMFGITLPTEYIFFGFLFFCIYFTWKVKLIRFLRGHLRGVEYRDKGD